MRMIKQAIFLMLLLPFWANAQTQSPPPTKQETIAWILKKMYYTVSEVTRFSTKRYIANDKEISKGYAYYRSEDSEGLYLIDLNKVTSVYVGPSYIDLMGDSVLLDKGSSYQWSHNDIDYKANLDYLRYKNRVTFYYNSSLDDNLEERFEKAFDALIDFNKVGKPAEKY